MLTERGQDTVFGLDISAFGFHRAQELTGEERAATVSHGGAEIEVGFTVDKVRGAGDGIDVLIRETRCMSCVLGI